MGSSSRSGIAAWALRALFWIIKSQPDLFNLAPGPSLILSLSRPLACTPLRNAALVEHPYSKVQCYKSKRPTPLNETRAKQVLKKKKSKRPTAESQKPTQFAAAAYFRKGYAFSYSKWRGKLGFDSIGVSVVPMHRY